MGKNRVTRGQALVGTVAVTGADGLTVAGVKPIIQDPITSELLAASVAKWIFIADRAYQVTAVREVHSVAGGASAAVRPRKITDTSAPGAAAGATVKELTTAAIDLTATINTVVSPALSATVADLQLAAGDRIALNFSGTLTGLVGLIEIVLKAI